MCMNKFLFILTTITWHTTRRGSDSVTLFNLPYATAVTTVGSESNLLRVGARGGETLFWGYVRIGVCR